MKNKTETARTGGTEKATGNSFKASKGGSKAPARGAAAHKNDRPGSPQKKDSRPGSAAAKTPRPASPAKSALEPVASRKAAAPVSPARPAKASPAAGRNSEAYFAKSAGSAKSGPANSGSAKSGSAKSGSAKSGSAKSGSARSGHAKSSPEQPAPARSKPAQPGSAGAGHRHAAPHSEKAAAPKLHSGQTIEIEIASTNSDGFGVANYQGQRVLAAGALQGERLVARVTYVGRREAFANTLKCLKPSADREPAPACHMGRCCDGCGLMQMRYPAQLAWKRELVARELRPYPSLSKVEIHDTLASPKQLGYRNSAKLVVAGKFTAPVIGIYRRNSHDVLEIEDCPLHHPLINRVVKAVKAGIKKGKVPIYNPKSEMGLLRYLVVRVSESENRAMVVFVTSDQGYNEIHHLAKFVQEAVPEVTVVAQNINTSTGNVIFGHKERFVSKQHTLRARLGDKAFSLSPQSFFQVNSGAARIIYEKVREFAGLTGSERVIDLYCGIGGISLFLADQAEEVVGIEVVEAAVQDAAANASLNGARNCSFEAGDAAHLIEEFGGEEAADLVVLNPPRKGCDERVLKSVAGIKPGRIIYVSCSPETLARDLDILSRLGYRTVQVQPVDMFPQTVHVENVALLTRNLD